jgi:hypothetical protein
MTSYRTDRDGHLLADPAPDLDSLLDSADPHVLLAVWATWLDRHISAQIIARDKTSTATRELFAADLARLAEVTAVQALTANRRLVELLTTRRWLAASAARDAGASWAAIGAALGISRQAAHEWHQKGPQTCD